MCLPVIFQDRFGFCFIRFQSLHNRFRFIIITLNKRLPCVIITALFVVKEKFPIMNDSNLYTDEFSSMESACSLVFELCYKLLLLPTFLSQKLAHHVTGDILYI